MIDDMVIRVGEPGPTIDFLFDQSPCSWEQTYDMQVTRMTKDPLNDSAIPSFIDREGTLLVFNEPALNQVGSYEFKICS